MLLMVTSLALLAVVGTSSVTPIPTPPTAVGVDSTVEGMLDTALARKYFLLKRDLRAYWENPAHAALLKIAQSTASIRPVIVTKKAIPVEVYDYPKLVKRDTALATIFNANHFPTSEFEPVQRAVIQALGELKADGDTHPRHGKIMRHNIGLIWYHLCVMEEIFGVRFIRHRELKGPDERSPVSVSGPVGGDAPRSTDKKWVPHGCS